MNTAAQESAVKPAFSPAPWRVNNDDLTVRSINDDLVHVHAFAERGEHDVANAQLIAAAPDLLEACQEAHDWLGDMFTKPPVNLSYKVREKCAAAIAKTITPDGCGRTISDGELVEVRPVVSFQVWVRLKKSSKYYHQGLEDCTDSKSKPMFFKLDGFVPQQGMALMSDQHSLKFHSNSYRREDCEFFLVDPKNPKAFVRIA